MTHICVSKRTIIGSDNGLSPSRRQAIIWNNAGLLLIEPLGTNVSEISIRIQTFSFKKLHLNMSSAKWRPFCLGLNELTTKKAQVIRGNILVTGCWHDINLLQTQIHFLLWIWISRWTISQVPSGWPKNWTICLLLYKICLSICCDICWWSNRNCDVIALFYTLRTRGEGEHVIKLISIN